MWGVHLSRITVTPACPRETATGFGHCLDPRAGQRQRDGGFAHALIFVDRGLYILFPLHCTPCTVYTLPRLPPFKLAIDALDTLV